MNVTELHWAKTSIACPEQYSIYFRERTVAYVRLRSGKLRVDIPVCGGPTIYENDFGDVWKGSFRDEVERAHFVGIINEKVVNFYERAMATNLIGILSYCHDQKVLKRRDV